MKVATPTVLGFRARGNNPQPHRRCLPLTGSEENATMLNPTVHESNYCSHHPHRRLADQGVFLRLSQWLRTQPQYKLFFKPSLCNLSCLRNTKREYFDKLNLVKILSLFYSAINSKLSLMDYCIMDTVIIPFPSLLLQSFCSVLNILFEIDNIMIVLFIHICRMK